MVKQLSNGSRSLVPCGYPGSMYVGFYADEDVTKLVVVKLGKYYKVK